MLASLSQTAAAAAAAVWAAPCPAANDVNIIDPGFVLFGTDILG